MTNAKIYVPNLSEYKCVVVRDKDTLRAYKTQPAHNTNIAYDDIYINSHYIYTSSFQSFGVNSTLPNCFDVSNLTSDWYYRNDLSDILLIFLIICIFGFLLPFKIFSRFNKRLFR